MKLVKSQIILYLYQTLEKKGSLDPKKIKAEFNLEDKTFLRYISEIKSYLYNFYVGYEIIYSRSTQQYYYRKK